MGLDGRLIYRRLWDRERKPEASAAEMYVEDDVMKRTPLPGDPGWPAA